MCRYPGSGGLPLRAACFPLAVLLTSPWAGAQTDTDRTQPAAPSADSRTRDQLFRDVFGRAPPEIPISAYLLVTIDASPQHKLRAVLSADERALRVEADALISLLAHSMQPEVVEALKRATDSEGWITRAVLEAAGIGTTFDSRTFTLSLSTDPRMRARRVEYLSGTAPSLANALRPAALSAFVNLNARGAHRDESSGGFSSQGSNLTVAADGAVNLRNFVLEGSGYAQSGDGRGFRRGDTRIVYDRPDEALRFSAGDLRYPVVGYQTVVDMGGVGVSRDFSLQPYLRNYQSSQFEFYLERPAEVRIWVNNSLVNTLQLAAGLHDIRGLSPAVGLNTTKLVIEDVSGRVQTLDFSFIYSPLLLQQGTNVFSWNAGFRRRLQDGQYRYDSSQPVVSASYLRGLRTDVTAGVYVQADAERAVAGAQAAYAMATSTVQLDAAVRNTKGALPGLGVKFDWVYLGTAQQGGGVQGQLRVEYLGARFGTINESLTSSRQRVNLYGTLSVPSGPGTRVQLAGYSTAARDSLQPAAYSLSAGWTRRQGAFTVSLGVRHRRSSTGETDRGLFFGVSYVFSGPGHNLYVAKDVESDSLSANWSTQRSSTQPGPYASASTQLGGGVREYRGTAGYWSHQGLVEASQARSDIEQGAGRFVRNETSVRMQSAVVFAGGALGLAPAVSENFAIVRGKEGLSGVDIKLDPDGSGGSRGQSNWFTPAVLGNLASYQGRDLRVQPVDPPIGAAPEKLVYTLAPGYKSGFLLELGREVKIIAVGRLLNSLREGLVNVPLEVRRVGAAAQTESIRTFTSRTGGFQLPDLRPGRYEIAPVGPRPWNTVIVDIPQVPDGLFRLGDIVVSP